MKRKEVFEACLERLNIQVRELEHRMNELKDAIENESKSSAGDKHETGRAMIHLEQENAGRELEEALLQRNFLHKCEQEDISEVVSTGTLLFTGTIYIYLSVAIGKIKVRENDVMVISSASPLGLKLLGKKKGESVVLNNNTFLIQDIIN